MMNGDKKTTWALAWAGAGLLLTAGCTTPDEVSKFCTSATTTLTSAKPIFEDMKQSCLREVNSRIEFGTFTRPSRDDAGCAAIGKQAEVAIADAKVLSDYFDAINSLATFGTATSTAAAATTTATGTPLQTALDSITTFLKSVATSGYQQRALTKDLTHISGNVSAVTEALAKIVQEDYEGRLLKDEESKTVIRYKDFAKGKSPEALLILDGRWQADEQAIDARRASADSLVTALHAISKGFADLAAKAHDLKAKEVPGLLSPYVTQIQTLIPQIQKAF